MLTPRDTAPLLHRYVSVAVMGIPDPSYEHYLIRSAQSRGADLIAAFASVQPTEASSMATRIDRVLDDYCGGLLEDLRRAVDRINAAEAAWLRQHYLRLIVEFATGVRDAISDSALRHSAAQVVQCKVLEHERNLRIALDTHGGLVTPPASAPGCGENTPAEVVNVPLKN